MKGITLILDTDFNGLNLTNQAVTQAQNTLNYIQIELYVLSFSQSLIVSVLCA